MTGPEATAEETATPERKGPAAILIVDDDESNCRLLEALLGPEGYATSVAASGEAALKLVAADPPDLILLDIMMPGLDGREVARLLKADPATRTIPIIIVTAQTDREALLAALEAGAEEFLTKPIDQTELWLRVRNLLRLKELADLVEGHRATLEAEVQARTAELQRFRSAMDATGDAILLISRASMLFVEVNATASALLGYTRDELLTLGPMDLAEGSRGQLETLFDTITAAGRPMESTEAVRTKDGSMLPVEVHRHTQQSGADWLIVSVLRDITERTEAQTRLHRLAHYDTLTGLPNRSLFYDTLAKTLTQATARSATVAVLFLDLDHFKNVNDTYGHAVGDQLLVQVSERLLNCVRIRDTVGRLGGDEFAVILLLKDRPPDPTPVQDEEGERDAAIVAAQIHAVLREPFHLDGRDVAMTASIGITLHPDDATDPETLIKYADTAMYQAKQAGRNAFRFFTPAMNLQVRRRLELDSALRNAVTRGEFVLHYQPKVQLAGGHVVGFEALVRWNRPGHGLVPPNDFIPALEESGLITEVGRWVIAAACEQISDWSARGIDPGHVSVNVSPRQFVTGDLERDVLGALANHHTPLGALELELTESSLMTSTEATIATLTHLKDAGVQLSIDDFGTGYSSLAYLRRFPIDKLKIDRSFIREVARSSDGDAITLAILRLGHSLELEVVAEGVETAAQLQYLRRHECDQMQGYYFSPPLPVRETERLLLARPTLADADARWALAAGRG
ncbi:putative bifunctional diguanylate cyclase/phosphodiesterase [Pengzhenrongella sicca]|uniref:EAL domain-containing protein n=1 Tax=Pengzhenrongella sicca TaxID=2819238 RepID=A0A8A4ZFD9_9MICO|nr:EAL domain-containing protein [Pengzhenrongella sicca]QTE30121.1 EAL domain-containing protein [Pengzhenrongella sicca]